MCGEHNHGDTGFRSEGFAGELAPENVAEFLSGEQEIRRTAAGFIGFGDTSRGDRVLLAIDNQYEYEVAENIARALRGRGATVDIVVADIGPDREFTELDEIGVLIRRGPKEDNPRRWDALPWIEELAVNRKYDLLVHKKGGGIPQTNHRYEAIPWLSLQYLVSAASVYPRSLHELINVKAWEPFHTAGVGGNVRVTDPEGTDFSYTLFQEYFDGTRRSYGETPFWGHLLAHGPTPILPQEDAAGVVAGTPSHFSRPFPRIELTLAEGKVTDIAGGGEYGAHWSDLLKETENVQYPSFPGPGLFYLWEVANGTHPKLVRPRNVSRLSSGGFEWEPRRSGVIHLGFGTRWGGSQENWSAERGIAYGHLHVHLLFPIVTITTLSGDVVEVIKDGRLNALDQPEFARSRGSLEIRMISSGKIGSPKFRASHCPGPTENLWKIRLGLFTRSIALKGGPRSCTCPKSRSGPLRPAAATTSQAASPAVRQREQRTTPECLEDTLPSIPEAK